MNREEPERVFGIRVSGWIGRTAGAAGLVLTLVFAADADARRNVYVSGLNTSDVAALDVGPGGGLAPVSGSPFSTGSVSAAGVAMTPDGTRLFAANSGSSTVSAFTARADGGLTSVGSPFTSGGGAYSVAVTPEGNRLYVANQGNSSFAGFDIAPSGALSPVPGSPVVTAGTTPQGVAVTPDGTLLYVVDAQGDVVRGFNIAANGSVTAITGPAAGTGLDPRAIAVAPGGTHVYVTNRVGNSVTVFAIGAGGALTPVGPAVPTGNQPVGIAITPDGRFAFVTNRTSDNVSAFSIGGDGGLTAVPDSPFGVSPDPSGVFATADSRRLYVSHRAAGNNVSVLDIGADGRLSAIGGSPFASGVTNPDNQSLTITPDQPPTASFGVVPAPAQQATSFDATGTTDPDGTPARYDWDFGDGATLPDGGPTPTHTYAQPGNYTAAVTVTDNEGCSTQRTFTGQTVSCNGGPSARTERSFVVTPETDPPGLTLSGKKKQELGKAVTVKATADEDVNLLGTGRLTARTQKGAKRALAKRTFKLRKANRSAAAGQTATLKLKVKKPALRYADRALDRDGKAKARLTVTAVDGAGNSARATRTIKLKP